MGCTSKNGKDVHWGDEGTLELEITLNKNTMKIDGNVSLKCILTNTGDTDLRYLDWYNFKIYINNSNGKNVWIQYDDDLCLPSNEFLNTLKSGENYTWIAEINTKYAEIKSNQSYDVMVNYHASEHPEHITKSYWTGSIWSNRCTLDVNKSTVHFDVLASRGFWINFTLNINDEVVFTDNYFEDFKDDEQLPVIHQGTTEIDGDSFTIKVVRDNSSSFFEKQYNVSDGKYLAIYVYSENPNIDDVSVMQRHTKIWYE